MKTKYSSYNINGLPEGCKFCVKGEKLVLFISGICSRQCWYCSLSDKRKNKDVICFNERISNSTKEFIKEIIESKATSMGITGGDPLLYLNRTVKFAKLAKKHFKKKFHIHIYIPTKLVDKNKIKRLSSCIDEIRFNPEISSIRTQNKISNKDLKKLIEFDIEKIKIAEKYFKKNNIGIELPMIPEMKNIYLDFILKLKDIIGFVNLNEFELSETNFKHTTKNYKLNEGGYTIKDSIKSGIEILKEIKKRKIKLKVHLCTAELKNKYQFQNRLKLHKTYPFGLRTKEGMVKYLVVDNSEDNIKIINKLGKKYFIDKEKNQIILSNKLANKILNNTNLKICLVEEFPTFDRIEVEKHEIK